MKCLLLLAALASAAKDSKDVLTLTDVSFPLILASTDHMLVEFVSPTCHHCKELEPEFAKAAATIKSEGIEFIFAKIDAIKYKTVAEEYGVTQFPSIRLFKKGGHSFDANNAGREADGIAEFARRAKKTRWQLIDSVELADKISQKGGVNAIGFLKTSRDEVGKAFIDAAESFRFPVSYFIATKKVVKRRLAELMGLDDSEGRYGEALHEVVLTKPYDEKVQNYTGFMEGEKPDAAAAAKRLNDWVQYQMMPLVVKFAPENLDMIFEGPLKQHLMLIIDPANKEELQLEKDLLEAATKARGEALMPLHILLVKDDADEELKSVVDFLKIKNTPAAIWSDMTKATEDKPGGDQQRFPRTRLGPISAETLITWTEEILGEPRRKKRADDDINRMFDDPKMGPMMRMMMGGGPGQSPPGGGGGPGGMPGMPGGGGMPGGMPGMPGMPGGGGMPPGMGGMPPGMGGMGGMPPGMGGGPGGGRGGPPGRGGRPEF